MMLWSDPPAPRPAPVFLPHGFCRPRHRPRPVSILPWPLLFLGTLALAGLLLLWALDRALFVWRGLP